MAEFVDVMRQWGRMCGTRHSCMDCPASKCLDADCLVDADTSPETLKALERTVMAWAAEHPKPQRPSWREWWKQMFPGGCTDRICPKTILPANETLAVCDRYTSCYECRDSPVPEDIARRLGVKLINGAKLEDDDADD